MYIVIFTRKSYHKITRAMDFKDVLKFSSTYMFGPIRSLSLSQINRSL